MSGNALLIAPELSPLAHRTRQGKALTNLTEYQNLSSRDILAKHLIMGKTKPFIDRSKATVYR